MVVVDHSTICGRNLDFHHGLLGFVNNRRLLVFVVIILYLHQLRSAVVIGDADHTGALKGMDLVRAFLGGVLLFRFREAVPYCFPLFILASIVCWITLSDYTLQRFAFLPAAYVTVYLGLLNPPRNSFFLHGDYSYGLYLYSSAIQQTIASFGPHLHHWYWSLILGYPTSFVVAFCSWWGVEQPALRLKGLLKSSDDAIRRAINQRKAKWCIKSDDAGLSGH
jgi:peptidoglycan/LPS O-acetylase OafA/YrhL